MGIHVVKQGECFASIAQVHGFRDWRAIYQHPENAVLCEKRPNPNVLLPGDRIFIPEVPLKQVSCATGQLHTFRLYRAGAILRLQLKDANEEPMADEPYRLDVEGRVFVANTDGAGMLEQPIPADAQQGLLGLDRLGLIWILEIGHLDPSDTVTGAQARLLNLGFDTGPVDSTLGPRTREALRQFQQRHTLPQCGELTDLTHQCLMQRHDDTAGGQDG